MLDFLSSTTENSPKIFGFVHFLVLGIFIALIIAICVFLRKTNEKQNNFVIFWILASSFRNPKTNCFNLWNRKTCQVNC